ncbi:MAG: hypothetical protein ABR568_06230 [Pyrinomonadaceae bacterium]
MRNFNGLVGLGRHLLSAACLVFLLAATTNAYSIVMRGGKRVEIPAQFSVTSTTLTYEAAPGFWITLQISAIDIPATERANNEMPGSLLGRITKEIPPPATKRSTQPPQSKASRSVTNRELASFQRLRLDSERAYEQRLARQGLPPLAVLRARAAADDERFWQESERKRAEAEANERISELQGQIAALSAQLDYLQFRSAELPSAPPDAFDDYSNSPLFGGPSVFDPGFSQGPFGYPIGGASDTYNGRLYPNSYQFPRSRRNTVVAPGTRISGRGGSSDRGGIRNRPHGRPRYR